MSKKRSVVDAAAMAAFKEEYSRLAKECKAAIAFLVPRIQVLQEDIGSDSAPSSRIKTPESCIEKIQRNGDDVTPEALREIRDIAGIRVVLPFEDNVYTIAGALQDEPGLHVLRVKDYICAPDDPRYMEYFRPETWTRYGPKPSGYSSLHMTIAVEVFHLSRKAMVPVEVQIRDKTMDAWASIEHICRYKCDDTSPEAKELFTKLSTNLRDLRSQAMQLRDYGENK